MRCIVITEQGAELGHAQGHFEVRSAGRLARKVREGDVEQVLVMGRIAVTPQAISACLRLPVDLCFATLRGQFRGRLSSGAGTRPELALAHHAALANPERKRGLAASFVEGKILNQRRLLVRVQAELQDAELAGALTGMRRMAAQVATAESLDGVRGHEGQAAALYWKCFGKAIRNERFSFKRRSFHPPRDPVNAALSFGYGILASACDTSLRLVGLDPGWGFLHETARGRPSLSLDLMEEFRPVVVDRVVLRLINRGELTPADFEISNLDELLAEEEASALAGHPSGKDAAPPIHLAARGREIVLAAFMGRLRERIVYPPLGNEQVLREIILLQARHLARVLQGEEPSYRSFVPR